MHLDRLPTPALVLEESVFNANRQAMRDLLQGSTLRLRPHYKSHKCAAIAHLQMADGAVGMTCAKLEEALDLADSGIEDILIANQLADPRKIAAAAQLALDCRLTVCADSAANIEAWEKAAAAAGSVVHILIEYEIGMQRCGVTDPDEVLALAGRAAACPHLRFDGLQAYAGHVSHMESAAERLCLTRENGEKVRALLARLAAAGLPAKTVSGGSTGTAAIKAAEGLYTELQAGSYLMMDATYAKLGLPFGCALTVLSTVVSSRPGLIVTDAGVKSCGVDQGMPTPVGLQVRSIVASEEHFQLLGPARLLSPGERLRLIPGHCCSTVNLYDRLYIADGDRVVDRLDVTARGCCK